MKIIIVVEIGFFSLDVFVGRVSRVLGSWVPWVEGDLDRRVLGEMMMMILWVGPIPRGEETRDREERKWVIV